MSEIPGHIKKLMNIEGFSETFIEMLSISSTNEEAYEHVERIFKKYFGQRKYSNYDSFRVCRDRFNKSKKQISITNI